MFLSNIKLQIHIFLRNEDPLLCWIKMKGQMKPSRLRSFSKYMNKSSSGYESNLLKSAIGAVLFFILIAF